MAEVVNRSYSSDISKMNKDADNVEFEFIRETGYSGSMSISDELLDTEARAKVRAESEFLRNSYRKKEVVFKTHLTNLNINDVIEVDGLPYLVKRVGILINQKSIVCEILGVRYE